MRRSSRLPDPFAGASGSKLREAGRTPFRYLHWLSRNLPVLCGVAILAYLYFRAPNFYRINNLLNILVQTSALGLLAIGMTFVMVGGGIDLSMTANMAFGAVLGGFVMRSHPTSGAVLWGPLVMLAATSTIGFLNGFAVAFMRMVPFVVTLATMTVVGGATVWMTNSVSVSGFPNAYFDIFMARIAGAPVSVLTLIVFAGLASLITSSTVYGRWLYSVGINARAARAARVRVERVTLVSYIFAGVLSGITAVLLTARLGSASANMGSDGVVLDIISSCVVGGVSIYGGVGNPVNAVFGAIFITLISNSLNLLGISYFTNLVIKGIVIIGFIALENLRRQAEARFTS
jgi:ribose/xylose/arabinose/galactoside ABC-type transport system permease subunit